MSEDRDAIDATVWRALRHVYLRVLSRVSKRNLSALSHEEQEGALDAYHRDLEIDHRVFREIVRHAWEQGISEAHAAIHRVEAADHDLIDDAIAGVREDGRDDGSIV